MNVLMVTSSYPKFPGDVTAPFMESIAWGVAARGHEVDVVLPHHPELKRGTDEPVRFFPYRYAPREGWSIWGYAQSLRADLHIRREAYLLAPLVAVALRQAVGARLVDRRYDVVHAHWVVPNAALLTDIVAAHRVPFVVSLHGSDAFVSERLRLARGPARWALQAAGSVTACSDDLRRRAVRLGAREERTRLVPYGVDVHAFSPQISTAGIRERLGVPADAILVLGLGRLVEKKGFRYLVEAAARAGGVHLVIAGEGDLQDALRHQAREAGLVASFPGALDRQAAAAALAAADVVVVPSVIDPAGNVDGLPNVLLEAMASGRPVIATRVAGIPEWIEDDVSGVLVAEKDPAALAEALCRLLREPDTRRRLGAEARRTAVERLSWEAAAVRFEDCYAQATALDAR
jgi:phosphatidyl-myo-inositol dimannoside synthase